MYLSPACHFIDITQFISMHIIESIGLLAAFLTTTAFFPQVIKTVKTKSTGDLSLPMYTLMFSGTVSWLIYGLLKSDLPITLANAISSLASFVIFYYKIREVRAAKKKLV